MDTSSAAADCVTLMAAAGHVVQTFPTGQGNVVGNPIVPVIGISGNPRTVRTVGQLLIAFDAERCTGPAYRDRIGVLVDAILAQQGARHPGERRNVLRGECEAAGLAVAPELLAELEAMPDAGRT